MGSGISLLLLIQLVWLEAWQQKGSINRLYNFYEPMKIFRKSKKETASMVKCIQGSTQHIFHLSMAPYAIPQKTK